MNSLRIRMKIKTFAAVLGLLLLMGMGWFAYSQLPSLLYYNGYEQQLMKWFPKSEYGKRAAQAFAYDYYKDYNFYQDDHVFIGADGSYGTSSVVGVNQEQADLDEGIGLLEGYLSEHGELERSSGFLHVLAWLYLRVDDWDRAEELFRQELDLSGSDGNAMEAKAWIEILESRTLRLGETPSIQGELKVGGRAEPNAYVVLQAAEDNGWDSNPVMFHPMTITDAQGRYRFYDVEPGEYKLRVGLLSSRLEAYSLSEPQEKTVQVVAGADDAAAFDFNFLPRAVAKAPANKETITGDVLRFEWEPYEGAAFYRINLVTLIRDGDGDVSGSGSRPLPGDYEGTEAVFSLEELRAQQIGQTRSYDSEGNIGYSPDSLLGPAYPGGEFMWSVDAFDERGLKLSSSGGTFLGGDRRMPLFRLWDEGMQEGDRLVVAGKYKEAIQAYEREGNDPHALRVLARITEEGTKKGEADADKALAYLERIQEPTEADLSEMERLREKMASAAAIDGIGSRESAAHDLQLLNAYQKEKHE
ncbi:carboxypeptidase-like regulatory domain-containing protein [Paenibacillus sp. HB172176]|uniref:carboxypeptidase-like regulatory domain-containing protein n=1 Tax=Paenibacillus sp. HB172176 TaxID=2493690 RepID=UPI00143BA9FC|nr:carboxypeptidase-like regulatory domain-containing protein [Paenibacillus sp. HB172176]